MTGPLQSFNTPNRVSFISADEEKEQQDIDGFLSQNHLQEQLQEDGYTGPSLPNCVRCHEGIRSGHAYELGDDRWHTHCFTCYRCEKSLSVDSDFLVLGTGALICFECSDSCKKCGKKIDDLAIILSSSNEAYCSDCFVCCKCGNNINDLRYARTKKGLFCLKCHEKLLAKRKYYEEKKRRLKKNLPVIPTPTEDENNVYTENASDPFPSTQDAGKSMSTKDSKLSSSNESRSSSILPLENNENIPIDVQFNEKQHNNLKENTDLSHLKPHKKFSMSHNSDNIDFISPNQKVLLNKTPLKNKERSFEEQRHEAAAIIINNSEDISDNIEKLENFILEDQFNDSNENIYTSPDLEAPQPSSEIMRGSPPLINPELYAVDDTNNKNIPSDSLMPPTFSLNHNNVITHNNLQTPSYSDISQIKIDKDHPSKYNDTNIGNPKIGNNNVEVGILASKKKNIIDELQREIELLEDKRNDLLNEINSMTKIKGSLFDQLKTLKEDIKLSKTFLIDNIQKPQFVASQDQFSNESSPVKNISTASIARPANKPKFWKFFSNKQIQQQQQLQQGRVSPSLPSSPMVVSSSSHNIPKLVQPSTSGLFHPYSPSPVSLSSSPRVEISEPVLQNPNEFKDVKLLPITKMTEFDHNIGNVTTDKLYGSTLAQRCAYENREVPYLLTCCIHFIESDIENMKSEGLYRKSGSKLTIEKIESIFESGNEIDLSMYDLNAVTSVLKRYLRNLPNPIITYQIYEPLIAYVRERNLDLNSEENFSGFIEILKYLPAEHITVLKLLGDHISKIKEYSEFNLMTMKNLSLVFTPSLIKDFTGERDLLDIRERNFIMEYIFTNYETIF